MSDEMFLHQIIGDHERKIERLEQQLAKTQAALDTSLAMQQEDEQEKAAMRALLEEASTCGDAALESRIRAFLDAHPAPERGLEAEDDE